LYENILLTHFSYNSSPKITISWDA
jgi:hypothetical protein